MNLGQSVYTTAEHLETVGGLGFDIDDLLAQTSQGFFDLLSPRFPPPINLTGEQLRKYYSLHGKIFHWGDIPEAKQFAMLHVDDPMFHAKLKPFPDAAQYTNTVDQHGRLACYITARLETMRESTEQWLSEHSFPRKAMVMRSRDVDFSSHTQWKAAAIHHLHPKISGIIDNDTRVIRYLEQNNYPGELYLFGLSPQEYSSNGSVIVRETWPEMAEAILKERS